MGGKSKSKYTILAFALVLLLPILASAIYIGQGSPAYLALHGAYDYIRSFTAMDSGDIRNSTLTGWICTALNGGLQFDGVNNLCFKTFINYT